MKGQVVLETLKDSKALSKAHKQIFNAFAEDNKRMEERMENLEKKMDTVLLEQSSMKTTLDVQSQRIDYQSQRIDYLIKILEEKKEEKKEKILIAKEIFISLVSKTGFWIVLILLIALVFNITIADLGAFIKATI